MLLQSSKTNRSPSDAGSGNPVQIRFERPRGADVPELSCEGFEFLPAEHASLIQELSKHYANLINRTQDRTVNYQFKTALKMFPLGTVFRVSQTKDAASQRTPGLVFEPQVTTESMVASVSETLVNNPPLQVDLDWTAEFLSHLPQFVTPELLATLSDNYEVHCIQAVLEDLRQQQQSQDAQSFACLLLAGYLSLGELHANHHDSARAGMYQFAGRALDHLLESQQRQHPCEVFEGRKAQSPLLKIFDFLARLTGSSPT